MSRGRQVKLLPANLEKLTAVTFAAYVEPLVTSSTRQKGKVTRLCTELIIVNNSYVNRLAFWQTNQLLESLGQDPIYDAKKPEEEERPFLGLTDSAIDMQSVDPGINQEDDRDKISVDLFVLYGILAADKLIKADGIANGFMDLTVFCMNEQIRVQEVGI